MDRETKMVIDKLSLLVQELETIKRNVDMLNSKLDKMLSETLDQIVFDDPDLPTNQDLEIQKILAKARVGQIITY